MPERVVMMLLAAIAECQPCDRVPDLPGVDVEGRARLMGTAYRAGWINISSFHGDGSLDPGQTLMLTDDGRKALRDEVVEQDAGATELPGADLETKKQRRSALMATLYEMTGGSTGVVIAMSALSDALNWPAGETKGVFRHLRERGLVEYKSFQLVALTPSGVDEVERAASSGDAGTAELAGVTLHTGDVSNSIIQAGTGNRGSAGPPPAPAQKESGTGLAGWVRRILADSPRQVIVAVIAGLLVAVIIGVYASLAGGSSKKPATGGSSIAASGSAGPALAGAAFRFDDLGGGSSVIEVFAGVTSSPADRTVAGTFRSGQTTTALCKTTGRTVTSNPSSGERPKQSNVWVQVAGSPGKTSYATLTYGDISPTALARLPECQNAP